MRGIKRIMDNSEIPLWAVAELIKGHGPVKVDGEFIGLDTIADYFDEEFDDESFTAIYRESGNTSISWDNRDE